MKQQQIHMQTNRMKIPIYTECPGAGTIHIEMILNELNLDRNLISLFSRCITHYMSIVNLARLKVIEARKYETKNQKCYTNLMLKMDMRERPRQMTMMKFSIVACSIKQKIERDGIFGRELRMKKKIETKGDFFRSNIHRHHEHNFELVCVVKIQIGVIFLA